MKVSVLCRNVDVNPLANCAAKICGAKHCWIKTDTKEAGMGPEGDDDALPSSPCCGTKVEIDDHADDKSDFVYDVPEVDEECVNQELAIGKDLGEWATDNQCNSFVTNILKKCGAKNKCIRWTTIINSWPPGTTMQYCAEWAVPPGILPPYS